MIDFKALFDAAPSPMIALAPQDWTIVAANDARVRVTGTPREEQVGAKLFEAFPDDPDDPQAVGVRNLRASLERVMATKAPDTMAVQRYAVRGTDGRFEERWWSPVNAPVLDAKGEVALVIHRVEEVTEIVRMRAEAQAAGQLAHDQQVIIDRLRVIETALRASEARYREIVEGAEDFAIVALDERGTIESWSSGAERMMGFTEEEALGRPSAIFFTPEDRLAGAHVHEMSRAKSHGRADDERWHQRKDGVRFWGSGLMMRREQPAGGFLKIFRDRTAEHEADMTIRAHEARYRDLFDAIDAGFCVVEVKRDEAGSPVDHRFLEVNPAFERQTGLADAVGRWASELAPEIEQHWHDAYARVALTGEATRFVQQASPLGRWYEVHLFRTGEAGENRVAALFNDVTERHAADERLRASEARLEAITNSVNQMIWSTRPDGYHDFFNDRWYEYTGVPPGSTDGAAWNGIFHPDDQARAWGIWRNSLETGEPYHIEYRLRHRSGQYRWVLGRAQAVRDDAGRIIRWYGTCTDIQEIVEAREVLALSGARLEVEVAERTAELDRVWRNSRDLLIVVGADGVFRAVNPAWTDILGHQPSEVVGHSFLDFIWPDDAELTQGGLESAAAARDLTSFENRYTHKDGSPRWISWHTSVEGELVYAYGRDVTAEKQQSELLLQAQEALRQAQKMEAVGQLTGGIAHDFNNMLAVVIGSLDLLNRRIGVGDARAKRYVDAAADGARRAATLTQRLLAFSRQQPLKPESIDVNKLVAGMSDLLRHSLGGDVQLETVLAGGLWRTHADPNQLENVLLNLAVNGRDAMPEGGRLTIETQNAYLDGRYAAAHLGLPAGQYVLVAVSDTGSGMPPEVIAKAFDPFFTTKEVGKGTGLGLSQVYGFVKQSGGHVKIYSEPGQGTSVKVYLPRLVGAELDVAEDAAQTDAPLGDSLEVVLVVEDEPAVRQFSVDALGELGYKVLEADGAAAALRSLDAHPEIVLMFTDIVMPQVNGAKLAEEARRRRPDLRVLFTTGYTRNAVVHNGVLDAGVELIGKPYTIEELAAKVRDVLDAPVSEIRQKVSG